MSNGAATFPPILRQHPLPNQQHPAKRQPIANWLIDGSILAVFLIAPLILGGRHPVGKFVLACCLLPGLVGLVIKVFAGDRLAISKPLLALLACCIVLPIIQTSPRLGHWTETVSPGISQLFPPDAPANTAAIAKQTLSVSAAQTQQSLPIIITFISLFALIVGRIENWQDAEKLLLLLVISALLIATLALLQANFGNGRFLWIYDHPTRDPGNIPRGPFQNENHLSSFLASILPVALYFLFRPSESQQPTLHRRRHSHRHKTTRGIQRDDVYRTIAACSSVIIVCTVYATPSRGGAVICAISTAIWCGILAWRWLGLYYVRSLPLAAWLNSGAGLFIGVAAFAGWLLATNIQRISYWRSKIWSTDLEIWKDFPLFGIGIGNHAHLYRAYLDEYVGMTFTTSESSWIQYAVETGLLGLAIGGLCCFVVFSGLLRSLAAAQSLHRALLVTAILAGLLASCLHATVDFPWHIPACFSVVVMMCAIATRLPALVERANERQFAITLSPQFSLAVVAALAVGHVWATTHSFRSASASLTWDQYARLARDTGQQSDDNTALSAGEHSQEIALLQETLRRQPTHIAARVKLANYLSAKLSTLATDDPRFASQARQLRKHCALLMTLCPTESRSYLYAASTYDLLGPASSHRKVLLNQSQRLRIIDGYTAIQLGMYELMQNNRQAAEAHFAIALERDPTYRPQAVRVLSPLYPAEQFIALWQPSRDTAAEMFLQSRQGPDREQMRTIGRYYCEKLVEEAQQADDRSITDYLLANADTVAKQIGDQELRLAILTTRIELNPSNLTLLLERTALLIKRRDLQSARTQLAACQKLSPRDARVKQLAFDLDKAQTKLR